MYDIYEADAAPVLGKYGFKPSELPFRELRPGTRDAFLVPIEDDVIRAAQPSIRAMIFNAARSKGCRIRVQRVPGGLQITRLKPAAPPVIRAEDAI